MTETDIFLSGICWTVKSISLDAFVSAMAAEIDPLHVSVRLSLLVDVVTILSPRKYISRGFEFSLTELGSEGLFAVEFSSSISSKRVSVVVRNCLKHGIPGFRRIALRLCFATT